MLRSKDPVRSQGPVAHAQLLEAGHAPAPAVVKRLRHGAGLHVSASKGSASTVTSLCSTLQDGSYYVASADGHSSEGASKLVQPHIPLQVYVLWPMLQSPPAWLLQDYENAKGAEVRVRWTFTFKQRAYLNVTNMFQAYQEQLMLVWQLRKPLQPGAELQIPAAAPPQYSGGTLLNKPWFDYVVCFKRQSTRGAGVPTAGRDLQDIASNANLMLNVGNLAVCALEHIHTALDEGMFHPSMLDSVDADALLDRVIAEGDTELLQMLMGEDLWECCTAPSLQLLLQYAHLEDLPELAEQLLQHTDVEMTDAVLLWMVQELLGSSNAMDLELLLIHYCVTRRNPLSSIATIEEALAMVGEHSSKKAQTATLLAHRFRTARHALLQQLCQQDSDPLLPEPHLLQQNVSSKALQEQLLLCFAEKGAQSVGRGGLRSSLSIHDSSPYVTALRLRDSEFFGLPHILEYTYRLWNGIEMETMFVKLWPESEDGSLRLSSKAFSHKGLKHGHTGYKRAQSHAAGLGTYPLKVRQVAGLAVKSAAETADNDASNTAGKHATANQHSPRSASTHPADAVCRLAVATAAAGHPGAPPGPTTAQEASSVDHAHILVKPARPSNPTGIDPSPTAWAGSLLAGAETTAVAPASVSPFNAADASNMPRSPARELGNKMSMPEAAAHSTHSSAPNLGNISLDFQTVSSTETAPEAYSLEAAISSRRWLNPLVGLELLQSMGLAGSGSQPVAWLASQAAHIVLLAPRALYCCPRGRWIVRCLFELLFLLEYQTALMSPKISSNPLIEGIFPILVLGNLVDVAFQLHYKFKYRIQRYLSDTWSLLDAVVNVGLFVLVLWALVRLMTNHWRASNPDAVMHTNEDTATDGLDPLWIVSSAFAVLMWARALGIIIPLSAKLGAMLYTLKRAATEASVLIPLILVVMLGFGTTLTVCYSHLPQSEYDTLAGAFRMLVAASGGALDLLWFEDRAGHSEFLRIWGQAILMVYIVLVNILIMTLLIAVINYSYHPVQVRAETMVMHAGSVQHYHWHRRHGITCSPGNILQLLLLWLPTGYRNRVPPAACLKYWVPPLDGYLPEHFKSMTFLLLPTGPAEVGYLMFLLTLYPLMSVVAVVALLLHVPLGVLHFAVKGFKRWVGVDIAVTGIKGGAAMNALASAATSLDGSALRAASREWERQGWRLSCQAGPEASGHKATVSQQGQGASSGDSGVTEPAGGATRSSEEGQGKSTSTSSAHQAVVAQARRNSTEFFARGSCVEGVKLGAAHTSTAGGTAAWVAVHHARSPLKWWLFRVINSCLSVLLHLLSVICTTVLAALVGLVLQVVLVLLLAATLFWAWVTRTVYSLYCIFIPAAANQESWLSATRTADLWTKDAVQAAFAASTTGTAQLQTAMSGMYTEDGSVALTPSSTINVKAS